MLGYSLLFQTLLFEALLFQTLLFKPLLFSQTLLFEAFLLQALLLQLLLLEFFLSQTFLFQTFSFLLLRIGLRSGFGVFRQRFVGRFGCFARNAFAGGVFRCPEFGVERLGFGSPLKNGK